MVRKKKSKTHPFIIKFILITLLVGGIGFGLSRGLIYLFRKTQYFRIQSVLIDSSLQFINKADLKNLIGKNIFEINLKAIERQLRYKYPQSSELKVIKHFPNQISVFAKPRLAFAQIQIQNSTAVLDEEGVMLSVEEKTRKDLPLVVGVKEDNRKLTRGMPFKGTDIQAALEIIGIYQANKNLSAYPIAEINVGNLSKIHLALTNGLDVILDQGENAQRIRVLGVVLSQGGLDLKHVKYIDLRFKEPIIGKK